MGEYKLLYLVLFTLIIRSHTWPKNKRDSDNHQSTGDMRHAATTDHEGDDSDDITFPDDEVPHQKPHTRRNFSAEGKGINCTENICESANDYPYEHIQMIVSRLHDIPNTPDKFVGNVIPTDHRLKPDDPGLGYLCETSVTSVYPQAMKNEFNISKFILNDKSIRQGIIYEVCVGSKCDKDASFPAGFETKCVQKYSKVRLLALEADSKGDAAYDTFVIPSCCVCAFTKPKV